MTTNLLTKSAEGVETFSVEGDSAELVKEYLRLSALKNEIEAAHEAARKAVNALFPFPAIGSKQIIMVGDFPVMSRKTHERDNVPVADLLEQYPEIYSILNQPIKVAPWRKA